MKTYLHKTEEGYILTSDEPIIPRDICRSPRYNDLFFFGTRENSYVDECEKVIAQQHQLSFSALSPEDQKNIEWFDVEEIVKNWYLHAQFLSSLRADPESFVQGFQKAQELLSDKEKIKDVQILLKQIVDWDSYRDHPIWKKANEGLNILQSLTQTSWEVEIEMENYCGSPMTVDRCEKCIDTCDRKYTRPKFTDGKIRLLKIIKP